MKDDEKTDKTKWEPPSTTPKSLIAKKTCTIELDNAIVELVAGQEVHGLTRQERDHLVFHGFVE